MPSSLVQEDDQQATLDFSEPSPEVMEYARKELGETDEARVRTLQELKDTIYERGEVTPNRMDDSFLLRFLRARSFNVERAHRLLKRYMRFREDNPTYQKGVNPESFSIIGEADVVTVLPNLDQHGRRILIFKLGNWDPSKISVDELFRATMFLLDLGIMEPRAQILGGVVIFDLAGIGLQHAWQVSPSVATKVIQLLETASPMQTMAIHILNESWVFDIIYGLFSPLLRDASVDKLFFHGSDLASLHEHIGPKYLPKQYGGARENVRYTAWMEFIRHSTECRREIKNLGYVLPDDMKEVDEQ